MSPDTIRERLRRGRWQRMYPGVYACFTGTIGRQPALWAAVLHAGPGAALSHQTAAQLHGLSGGTHDTPIHVTVPSARHPQPVRGLVIYRSDRGAAARHPTRLPPRTRIEQTVLDLTQAALARDNAAASTGIITLRYSWFDVTRRPCLVAAEIAAVLSTRGWPGTPARCGPSCQLPQTRIS